MPFPRWVARFNLHITNRILGPLASRHPGMGVVIHVGRKTGHEYRTPVMVFRRGDRFIIALTYGRDAQWVQNVLATNDCQLETRKQNLRLEQPRIMHDERRQNMPPLVRLFLGALNVSDFLELTVGENQGSQSL